MRHPVSKQSNKFGGLGLATGSVKAAHWASWAECIPNVKQRHLEVAEAMVAHLNHHEAPSFEAVRKCADTLREARFEVPTWESVLAGLRPGQNEEDTTQSIPTMGGKNPPCEHVTRTEWQGLFGLPG